MELKCMTLGYMGVNSYILFDKNSHKAALFDAPAEAERILKFLAENGLELEYIFLTHGHFDHIGALSELKTKTGAKIVIHKDEEKYLNDSALNLTFEPLPEVYADVLVNGEDIMEFCDTKIRIIHTPGHTVGGVCYYFDNILISGDTLFQGSIGRFDFPLGDFATEIKSIKEKILALPDETQVYPGHGLATTIGAERKENPYLS